MSEKIKIKIFILPRVAHSIPVDVPSSPKRASTDMVENEDSGISGSCESKISHRKVC